VEKVDKMAWLWAVQVQVSAFAMSWSAAVS
jgi:hypothetical protein